MRVSAVKEHWQFGFLSQVELLLKIPVTGKKWFDATYNLNFDIFPFVKCSTLFVLVQSRNIILKEKR